MARFAEVAARLAGVVAVLLGWRPEEFWRATPEELAGVLAALAEISDAHPIITSKAKRCRRRHLRLHAIRHHRVDG